MQNVIIQDIVSKLVRVLNPALQALYKPASERLERSFADLGSNITIAKYAGVGIP